jgi:uncharacterized membrane protein YccC|tara:strand:+ start:1934 stop:2125 length:192 start_codon:yes stop_codon:yes gene_type:complete
MTDTILFSFVNVGTGFVISWLLAYYVIPIVFKVERQVRSATKITLIYTVAAIARNIIVFGMWV